MSSVTIGGEVGRPGFEPGSSSVRTLARNPIRKRPERVHQKPDILPGSRGRMVALREGAVKHDSQILANKRSTTRGVAPTRSVGGHGRSERTELNRP